jgi:hypothetical protein
VGFSKDTFSDKKVDAQALRSESMLLEVAPNFEHQLFVRIGDSVSLQAREKGRKA